MMMSTKKTMIVAEMLRIVQAIKRAGSTRRIENRTVIGAGTRSV